MDFFEEQNWKLTPEKFNLLIQLMRQGQDNAFIHLGNLLIDDRICLEYIEATGAKWIKYYDNEYFEWMLWVLIAKGYEPNFMLIAMLAS